MKFLNENTCSMESYKSLFSSTGHTWLFRFCTNYYSMNCYMLSNYVVTIRLITSKIYSVLHYTVKIDQMNWCESLQQLLGSFWEGKAAWWWSLTFTQCWRFGRTRAVPQWERQGIFWAAVPAMLEVKARTVKLFRLVACTLYSHFEDLIQTEPSVNSIEQCFSNFFQVGTTFISQNVLRTTLLLGLSNSLGLP